MKKFTKSIYVCMLIALQFAFSTNIIASDYFWVGGTGNWSDHGNHWATASGGVIFHTQNPTPNDDVFFDANSFSSMNDTVCVDLATIYLKDMDWTGALYNPVFTASVPSGSMNIYGSLILSSNLQWDIPGMVNFKATTPGNIVKTGNVGFPQYCSLTFNGIGGEWTLSDSLIIASNLQFFDGSFISGNNFISCNTLTVNTSLFSPELDFGTSEIYCTTGYIGPSLGTFEFSSSTIYCYILNSSYNTFGRVYSTGSSEMSNDTINFFNGSLWGVNNFIQEAFITNEVKASSAGSNKFIKATLASSTFGNHVFWPTCIFDTLVIYDPGTTVLLDTFIINNLLVTSPSISLLGSGAGNSVIIAPSSATICLDYIYLENMDATGGATFYAGSNSFDLGNNTGWTWTSCTPAISNVWPGDANYDLTCDNLDLLNIGIAFNETGPARPGASLAWTAQPEVDWNTQFVSALNVKHADCDGNGVVDAADTLAVSQNYGLSHPFRLGNFENNTLSSGTVLYFDFSGINLSPGSTVSVPINLANSFVPVNDAYGIAFTIGYPASMVQAGSVYMDYSNSWLVTAPDYIHLEKDFSVTGYLDMGLCRTDHQPVDGYGTIAMLHFTVSNNASGLFSLMFYDVKAVTDLGIEIPVSPQQASVLTGINEFTQEANYYIYPNPVSDYLYFTKSEMGRTTIEIIDRTGRVVLKSSTADNKIYLGGLAKGIYSVLFYEEKKYSKQAVRVFKN